LNTQFNKPQRDRQHLSAAVRRAPDSPNRRSFTNHPCVFSIDQFNCMLCAIMLRDARHFHPFRIHMIQTAFLRLTHATMLWFAPLKTGTIRRAKQNSRRDVNEGSSAVRKRSNNYRQSGWPP
jgi:hypothetical protein